MSRRSLSLNFRRRVFGMLSTLFRRRWSTMLQHARRSRLGRRLRELAEDFAEATATSTKLVNTHLLTLSQPEYLEQRQFMDVGASKSGSTLYIWMDSIGTDRNAYIAETFQGITVGTDSCLSLPGQARVVPGGQTPAIFSGVSNIIAYQGLTANWSGSDATLSGGSGYTTAPSISFSNTTPGVPATGYLTLNLSGAAVTSGGSYPGSGSSTNYGVSILTSTGANTGATADVDFTSNVISTVTINQAGSNFTSTSGFKLALPTSGGVTPASIAFNGSVDHFHPNSSYINGTGYYTAPIVTISGPTSGTAATYGSGSLGGPYYLVMNGPPAATIFTSVSQSNPLTPTLAFGTIGSAPKQIVLSSGLTNSLSVQEFVNVTGTVLRAGTLSITGEVAAAKKPYSAVVADDISISGQVTAGSLDLYSKFGNIALTGDTTTVNDAVTLYTYKNNGTISLGSLQANSFAAQSNFTFTSTGLINATAGVTVISDTGNIILGSAGISATSGNVVLSALDTTNGSIYGNTAVVATGLTIREGTGASVPYTITGNLGFLTGSIASDITFTNSRSLTIGSGTLTTRGKDLTIQTSGSRSDLVITGGIASLNSTGTNITLTGGGNVSITNPVTSKNRPIAITAGSLLTVGSTTINAGTNALNLAAGTGIDGGNNILAGSLTADSVSGNINLASSATTAMKVYSATTTSGDIKLQSLVGDLSINGPVSTTVGNITLFTGQTSEKLILNGAISTDATGTVTLTAANYASGTITNFSAFTLSAGALNITAAKAPALLLDSANVSIGNLSASISGSTEKLKVVVASQLNLTGVSTQSGPINITVTNGNLTVLGAVNAGVAASPQNVILSAVHGSLSGTGTVLANVLEITANGSSSLTTTATTLNASITGVNQSLTISETKDLQIGGNNVVTNGGDILINVAAGSLTRTNTINAAGGNVTVSAAGAIIGNGSITANTLDWRAANQPDETGLSYSSLRANVTGAGNSLVLSRTGDLTVLNATTASGNITLNVLNAASSPANLTLAGTVLAGSTGGSNVTLNVNNGSVFGNANGVITANVVNVSATNGSAIFTSANTLTSNISAGGLTVTEANGLVANNVTATGNIAITVANGSLTRAGAINAVASNVTLTVPNGSILGTGAITGTGLDWTALSQLNGTNTSFSVLSANVTGANNDLVINQATSLTLINAATASGNITVNYLSNASLTITGSVRAGTAGGQNVTLNAATGSINTSSGGLITASVLNVTAANASTLNTNVATLTARITNASNSLTVTEADGLQIGNITTNSSAITITAGQSAPGNLSGTGTINAGTSSVTLTNANGAITLNGTGQIIASALTATAQKSVTLGTNVDTINASVTNSAATITIVDVDTL